jgi:hypothetical protein
VHRERHIPCRILLLCAKLNDADIVRRQYQTVAPEIVDERRDVALKVCPVSASNPGEDMLSIIIWSLVEGASSRQETVSQQECLSCNQA